ncbi:MAG: Gfo/Idh/MocA family protein [Opitutales bacterium]
MNKYSPSRRTFFKGFAGISAAAAALTPRLGLANPSEGPKRGAGARYMGGYAAPKLDKVRAVIIGTGSRGSKQADRFSKLEGVEIVGLCDVYEDLATKTKQRILRKGGNEKHPDIKLYHGSKNAWKRMLEEVKPNTVLIATPWEDHAEMAIASMEAGAHTFVELPLATTIKDLWRVIDCSERTQKHCMMMENVNYGREELMFLNMVRQGVIGELVHGESAYIHELRKQMRNVDRGTGFWRTLHYAKRNGNLYPPHGLGPISQYMNLARGDDNYGSIVSMSSQALGRAKYAKENFPADHKWNQLEYKCGDINTSIIKTYVGRTIMIQWDETSPRPYTRHNLIQGTEGTLAGFPTRVALEMKYPGAPKNYHQWAEDEKLAYIYETYDHPLYKRTQELAKSMGGHGGMDAIKLIRMAECLLNGEPLDQNVYESAFWSSVGPLSEASVAQGGMPQQFPDFTRGNWKNTDPLAIVS